MTNLRVCESGRLSSAELRAIRGLLDEAFAGDFSDHDWEHALGGWHALITERAAIVAHASVVPRRIEVGTRVLHVGYVESVAVASARQRSGLGTAVMEPINDLIRTHFELGALSTGAWHFYERLGWERWKGPTWIRRPDGSRIRSAEEDDAVMVLRPRRALGIDLAAAITCEERPGESW